MLCAMETSGPATVKPSLEQMHASCCKASPIVGLLAFSHVCMVTINAAHGHYGVHALWQEKERLLAANMHVQLML